MELVECVVIGAGVIGLAIARQLAQAGREVVILEAETTFGTVTSARNSEVIHAGIYYPAGSLKAALCVRGRNLLYDYCRSHGVAHRQTGKLIVATDPTQHAELERIKHHALANGVHDIRSLSAADAQALEPALRCSAALLSPSTGIIDSHGLMLSLLGDAQAAGAMLAVQSPVLRGRILPEGAELEVGGSQPMTIAARTVINCAGLRAPAVARALDGFPTDMAPTAYFAKGSYFGLTGRAPFSHLIYPIPEAAGLGVHLTLDLGGQAKFGPNVEWVDRDDADIYHVDPRTADGFYAEVRKYWPALPDHALQPGYAGLRPKITGPGETAADFRIDGPAIHGCSGIVQLYGIESPGLTSSLALAEHVVQLLPS